jgi:hypothetical protein
MIISVCGWQLISVSVSICGIAAQVLGVLVGERRTEHFRDRTISRHGKVATVNPL